MCRRARASPSQAVSARMGHVLHGSCMRVARVLCVDGPRGGGPRVEIIFPFSKGLEMVLYFIFRAKL